MDRPVVRPSQYAASFRSQASGLGESQGAEFEKGAQKGQQGQGQNGGRRADQ